MSCRTGSSSTSAGSAAARDHHASSSGNPGSSSRWWCDDLESRRRRWRLRRAAPAGAAALGVGGRACRSTATPPPPASPRRVCAASRISARSGSPRRRTCGTTIPGACSRCRGRSSRGCTPRPAPRASPRWWGTPGAISRCGARSWHARSPAAPSRATSSRSPTATACSRAAWASTTGPSTWVSPWFPCRREHHASDPAASRPATGARLHSVVRAAHRRDHARVWGGPPRARRPLRFFGAEPWTEAMRAQLEALWGFSALDFYGLSELIGPGVAVECLDGREGLHVNEDHFLPEVVDPASGAPLAPGKKASWSSPRSPRKPCPCSATGPVTSRASTPSRAGAAGRRYAWRGSRATTTCW